MKLLTGHEPFEEILAITATGEQVYLSASAMSLILDAIAKMQFSTEAIQRLGDALECESVDYEDAKSAVIAQSLFELSSPEINGLLTAERCVELIAALEAPDLSSSALLD
jgi:hypothetical protein